MLFVLILYCSGICPDRLAPPNGVLFFSSLEDCHTAIASIQPSLNRTKVYDENGRAMKGTRQKQTCATMYADPKQLDRILDPKQLAQLLKKSAK